MGFKTDVINRLERMRITQEKHNEQLAVNNHILDEHQKRSTQLEARVLPLEQSHVFFVKLSKALVAFATLGASITAIIHYLFR